MEFITFLILQFLAHLLTDFFFQTQKMARQKAELGFKSGLLIWHAIIAFGLSWLFSFQLNFVIGATCIAILHYIIDGFKKTIHNQKLLGPYSFFIDQALHSIVLIVVVCLFNNVHGLNSYWIPSISLKNLVLIVGYLVCLRPSNFFIKEVLRASGISSIGEDELPNAGKLIGDLERILALTFIVLNQYEAVGFLLAAKSILRYRDHNTIKTEYVLIGTMLSFAIALAVGIFYHFV